MALASGRKWFAFRIGTKPLPTDDGTLITEHFDTREETMIYGSKPMDAPHTGTYAVYAADGNLREFVYSEDGGQEMGRVEGLSYDEAILLRLSHSPASHPGQAGSGPCDGANATWQPAAG